MKRNEYGTANMEVSAVLMNRVEVLLNNLRLGRSIDRLPCTEAVLVRLEGMLREKRLRDRVAARLAPRAKEEPVLKVLRAPEIRQKRGDVALSDIALTDDRGRVTGRAKADAVQSQLRRMLRRKQICGHQFTAGETFARHCELGTVSMKSCLDVSEGSGVGVGFSMPGTVGENVLSFEDATQACALLGPLKGVVQWVACDGRSASEWAEQSGLQPRSGIDMLKVGLDVLVRHYGLDCHCQSDVSARSA